MRMARVCFFSRRTGELGRGIETGAWERRSMDMPHLRVAVTASATAAAPAALAKKPGECSTACGWISKRGVGMTSAISGGRNNGVDTPSSQQGRPIAGRQQSLARHGAITAATDWMTRMERSFIGHLLMQRHARRILIADESEAGRHASIPVHPDLLNRRMFHAHR